MLDGDGDLMWVNWEFVENYIYNNYEDYNDFFYFVFMICLKVMSERRSGLS